jgi:hypothetical protein
MVFAKYCQFLDDGRLDDVSRLFADDGVLALEAFGVRETGPAAIRAKYDQITDPRIKGAHSTSNHIIEVAPGGNAAQASADFMFVDYAQGPPRIITLGRYRARFVAVGGEWKIKEWNIELRANAAAG